MHFFPESIPGIFATSCGTDDLLSFKMLQKIREILDNKINYIAIKSYIDDRSTNSIICC